LLTPKPGNDTLAWVVDACDILGIHHLQALQEASIHLETNQHLSQHFMQQNIERFFEVHKTAIE
jgi:hypothetical protein